MSVAYISPISERAFAACILSSSLSPCSPFTNSIKGIRAFKFFFMTALFIAAVL